MAEPLQLNLPDGRSLEFQVRKSARARSVWLRVTARDGLVVTVPKGVALAEVLRLVRGKVDWVARHLAVFETPEQAQAKHTRSRPERMTLEALGEVWSIEYREGRSATVSARSGSGDTLLVSGAVEDEDACRAALRRWLMRRARAALDPWLAEVARESGLSYSGLSVKGQRRRWGSCTHDCRISLNGKLLFLPPELVRYVMVHELCHTREHNHSARFWALVRRHAPDVDLIHARMREAWRLIPDWAERG